jgi:hypothetical protein
LFVASGTPWAKEVKRFTVVSFQQVGELCAKGVLDEHGFSVRMCAPDGKPPNTTPVKKLFTAHIKL